MTEQDRQALQEWLGLSKSMILSGESMSPQAEEVFERAKAALDALPKFEPGRWWRVIAPDGSLWSESSDEEENRECMRPGDTLQRIFDSVIAREWRDMEGNNA